MKLVTFKYNNFSDRLGLLENDWVYDLNIVSNGTIPSNIIEFLNNHDRYNEIIKNINLKNNKISINDIIIQSPILKPNSLRDAYAFRQHVEAGRKNRGLKMIPEYDMFPVFYYGNHNTVSGQGIIEIQHETSEKLDYELVDFHSDRPGHDLRYGLDGNKMRKMGWTLPIDFETSLRNTVKWTIENQKWLYL